MFFMDCIRRYLGPPIESFRRSSFARCLLGSLIAGGGDSCCRDVESERALNSLRQRLLLIFTCTGVLTQMSGTNDDLSIEYCGVALVLFAVAVYSVFAAGKATLLKLDCRLLRLPMGRCSSIPAGDVDSLCDAGGSDCGDDLRLCAKPSAVARSSADQGWADHDPAYCVYLVRSDRIDGYVCRGKRSEFSVAER